MGNFVSSSPNEAILISGLAGTRVAVGTTTWRWMLIDKVARLPLELMTLELHSVDAETVQGVRLSVSSTAQVKIRARTDAGYDKRTILLAAQHFLNAGGPQASLLGGSREEHQRRHQEVVGLALKQTLEGHQRQILGTLTVEQIYKDRAAFSAKIREHCEHDISEMGFEIVSYSMVQISDKEGYMDALGATQTALVKREAQEGQAKNESEARIKVAQAESIAKIEAAKAVRAAHVVANQQKEAEAESDQILELKRAEYLARTGEAKERADAAAKIERAKQDQDVIRQRTQQKLVEKEVETRVAEQEALRLQTEAEGTAKARLMAQEQQAKAILVLAEAEAQRVRVVAQAEADAIRYKGEADAANLRLQAEAYAMFGDAALATMLIEKLPLIAAEISKPLAKTEKMVFVSTGGEGGGPSAFTKDFANILGQLPATVESLTGFDLRAAMSRTKAGKHGTLAIREEPTEQVASI